jgi:hypothetical protein
MKRITRKFYIAKDSLELIEKDINAVNSYVFFSNKEEGTQEVDITIDVPEEFRVSEELIETIVTGLLPALGEKEINTKIEQVKAHLRSVGASL